MTKRDYFTGNNSGKSWRMRNCAEAAVGALIRRSYHEHMMHLAFAMDTLEMRHQLFRFAIATRTKAIDRGEKTDSANAQTALQ